NSRITCSLSPSGDAQLRKPLFQLSSIPLRTSTSSRTFSSMLGFLPGVIGIALLHHVEIRHAPVMRPVDFLAPADNVCGRELGALENRLQVFALPAYMVTLPFRDQNSVQEIFRRQLL